jgi:hypothetical protein
MSYLFLQDSRDPNLEKFPFHYNNKRAVDVLSNILSDDGIVRWRQCAEEAMNCCDNMEQKDLVPGIEFEIYFRT